MKKYIVIIISVVLLVLIGMFIFKQYNSKFTSKPQLKYSELEDYLIENTDCLIYVTNKKNNKEVNNYFKNKDIEIVYLYLDKKEISLFENTYGITNLPKFVYFKDGVVEEYVEFDKTKLDEFLNRNGFIK